MEKNILDLVNAQINEELFSAYAYLDISARAEALKLPGFAHWFRIQAQEEIDHAMGFFHHLTKRQESIKLSSLANPTLDLHNAASLTQAALDHEKHITKKINELSAAAKAVNDEALVKLLEWYIEEQIEEEENIGGLLEKIRLIGDDSIAMATLDNELAERRHEPAQIS